MSDEIIEDWHGKAGTSSSPYAKPAPKQAVIDARREVHAAMTRMPYGAGVHFRQSQDYIETVGEPEFLNGIAGWITALADKLRVVSESTTDIAAELNELRAQRNAVRNFLGLNERNTP